MAVEITELPESSSANPLVLRLREIISLCSKSVEGGDLHQTESAVSELVNFLDSVSADVESDPENEDTTRNAFEVLLEIDRFLCSSSTDQAVIDALSFELPKAVSKYAGASVGFVDVVNNIIDRLIASCSPRDLLSIFCEALDSSSRTYKASGNVSPLLNGLSKVFLTIQRRHFEQIKAAVPVIIKVLKAVASESDDEGEFEGLFDRAICIANSMHAVCIKLEDRANEKLRSLLGLYLLQVMALISVSMGCKPSSCLPWVSNLARLFPFCGLSYLGLITGCVDTMTAIVYDVVKFTDDEDDYRSCLSNVNLGASVSVIWGHISDSVSQAAEDDLTVIKGELQRNQIKRWQAIGMLRYALSSAKLPWELKRHATDFLLSVMNENISMKNEDETDCALYISTIFAALQAVTMVIIYTSDTVLRKNAFDALKRVLGDIPVSQRFNVLSALISNSNSSSMTAILIDLVRREMHMERSNKLSTIRDEVLQNKDNVCENTSFWTMGVLELVELVLRPPKGGPPSLPEHGDAVLSALNLYRFVLLTESAGKTNYTGVLSKNNLEKAYDEWLLPLRTLVTGIVAENKNDCDQLASDTVCALNPVELVLYRCIELVEEKLKSPARG